ELTKFSCYQMEYSPLERSAEVEILPFCRSHSLQCFAWSPFARGYLLKREAGAKQHYRLKTAVNDRIILQLNELASAQNLPLSNLILKWIGRNATPIVGFSSVEQVRQNLEEINFDPQIIDSLTS